MEYLYRNRPALKNFVYNGNSRQSNWLPNLDEIADGVAKRAVLNAMYIDLALPVDDENALQELSARVAELDAAIKQILPDFPHETDLEKVLRFRNAFEKHGLPLKEALALLVIRQAKLGLYGEAVEAHEAYDATLGRDVRKQRSDYGKLSHVDLQDQIAQEEKIYQELADYHWRANPRLSKRDVADLVHKEIQRIPEADRPCRLKSPETIRRKLIKPPE